MNTLVEKVAIASDDEYRALLVDESIIEIGVWATPGLPYALVTRKVEEVLNLDEHGNRVEDDWGYFKAESRDG